ncbi:Endonuclease/exonuclease/phosphatase [Cinara cedri]|uniref:Endonuclease/exonuclease/phosphatase n=1 Tax=Cinara cedri TaxID=506608 RepID=A0A5E4NLI2_9HEMI|nr:Endonuclease/exonuclease/phosphatase [Cinara cedri]
MYENITNPPHNIVINVSIWTQIQNDNSALKQMVAELQSSIKKLDLQISEMMISDEMTTGSSKDNLSPSKKPIKVLKEIARTSIKIHKPPLITVCGSKDTWISNIYNRTSKQPHSWRDCSNNKRINHELGKHSQKYLQATNIRVNDGDNGSTISAIYCPPRYKVDKHTFWGSRLITTKGRDLFTSVNKIKAPFITTIKSTYWPTGPDKLPDLINFYVMKGISSNYEEVEGLIELTSDHIPVLLSLSSNVIVKQKKISIANKKRIGTYLKVLSMKT